MNGFPPHPIKLPDVVSPDVSVPEPGGTAGTKIRLYVIDQREQHDLRAIPLQRGEDVGRCSGRVAAERKAEVRGVPLDCGGDVWYEEGRDGGVQHALLLAGDSRNYHGISRAVE